jgi:hypothetical protein
MPLTGIGVPLDWFRQLAAVEIAGAIGLLAGLFVPAIGDSRRDRGDPPLHRRGELPRPGRRHGAGAPGRDRPAGGGRLVLASV